MGRLSDYRLLGTRISKSQIGKMLHRMNIQFAGISRRFLQAVASLACTTLLVGCNGGATLAFSIDMPRPVVEELPVNVAVYYSPEIANYTFTEEVENFGQFKIHMSNSHANMFRTVFGALFAETQELKSLDFGPSKLDGILVPRIEEVQIALPQQTRSDFYEVWIRYTLELHKTDGTLLNQWSVAAYGKANRRNHSMLGGSAAVNALREASEWALRDAAATIALSFSRIPAHQQWIAQALRT